MDWPGFDDVVVKTVYIGLSNHTIVRGDIEAGVF
jgi:hypothetical protein